MTDQVLIFDTTLRDGEQSPGATMTHAEKLEIAELLDEMGVDIIEAGFPIASEGDFKAVSEISRLSKSATICGLARANYKDIDRCWEAVKHAKSPRIHTFIGTSELHRAIPNLTMDEMAVRIHDTVTHARNLCDNVQWSPMDATRTEWDYLCRVVEIAIKAGATTINIPDTVGYTAPRESADLIRMLINKVPGADEIIFATHCHNDLGMATANSLAAVEGGARQIECTINGLGERAGNTALEEVVMALKVRHDIMPFSTKIDTTKIMQISRRVATVSGFNVQFNKAIVGKNAFAHESGIHQDGMLKNAETYEIMTPESVGIKATSLVMGKHSGRHAFKEKLKELGVNYGKGLQLINILRDLPEDLENGRCYLPNVNAKNEDKIVAKTKKWRKQAREYLEDGMTYAKSLRQKRARIATALPAMIGLKTLDLLDEADWETWKQGIKVSRKTVRRCVWKAMLK